VKRISHINFTRNVGLVGVTQLLVKLRGIFLLPIIAKTLGVFQYGLWSQIIVTVSLFTPFITMGLLSSITRFLSAEKNKKEIQEGLYSSLITIFFFGLIFGAILFLLSDYLAITIFNSIDSKILIKISSLIIIIAALDEALLQFFRAQRRIKLYSGLLIFESFCELALIGILILLGFELFSAVFALLIIKFIIFIIMISKIILEFGLKKPNFSKLKSYFIFGLPLMPSVIFGWVINFSDRYVIGYYFDNSYVGVYSASYNIGTLILFFVTPISIVLYPTILKLWKEKKIGQVKTYFNYSLKYFLMLSIPSAVGLSLLSKPILKVFTTSQFLSGAILIPIISISAIFYGIYMITMYVFGMIKKPKIIGMLLCISAFINIIINLFIIPIIGIIGASISTLISFLFLSILMYWLAIFHVNFFIDCWFIIKSLFSALIIAFLIIIIDPISVLDIVITIIISIFVYFSVLLILKSFKENELVLFRDIFKIKK